MGRLELGILDKIISKGLLGRRQLNRATKFNIANKQGGSGVLELMYQPRNKFEQLLGRAIHSSLPLLSYFTYRFHVERARAGGFRVEDHYHNKFFRESYVHWHIYAQNFHPATLGERVRSVHFYRKTKTLFKGFKVPDWAQDHKKEGWDVDVHYSRQAWDNAMREFNSEWTPMPFAGERLDPNIINWFRFEQIGKGFSSRLFYNENIKPSWHRHGGHLDEPEQLHSFKYADQSRQNSLGFDTSTKEGRAALEAEVQRWRQMTPEIYDAYGFDSNYNSVQNKFISVEPHFQRALTHYRTYEFQQHIERAITSGDLTHDDVNSARPFFDEKGLPNVNMLVMGQKGLLGDDAGWESFQKVLEASGLAGFEQNLKTSKPAADQFQAFLDTTYEITEKGLTEALPLLITDERDRSRVQELIEAGQVGDALPKEKTQTLVN
jgi:hypothetical protein